MVAGVANQVNGVAPNREIGVVFSEDMDPSTINAQTFSISGVAGTVSYDAASRIASLKPNNDLQPNTQYSATVTTGVASSTGTHMAQNYVFSFTTRAAQDTSPPQVMSITPANHATCVDVNSKITVIFDEGLDPATINNASFFISGVQGTVTYDAVNLSATLTPSAPLQQNTTYTGTLTASIADLADVALSAPVTFSFTTGPCGGGVGGGANTFLYVGVPTTPAIRGYQVDFTAANLTEVPGSPFRHTGTGPGALIVNKDFVYATSTDQTTDASGAPVPSGTSTIWVYRADASGTLTQVQTLTVPTTQAALFLEPTGHNIYDLDVNSNILTLTINADGTLTNTGSKIAPPGTGPLESLAFSPNGLLAYATVVTGTVPGCNKGPCPTDDATWEVNRDATSGALTFTRQVGTNQHLFEMQIDPTGKYLLAQSTSPNQISVCSINSSTGDLTPAPGSPYSTPRSLTESGDDIRTYAPDPSGNFVYALSFGGPNFDREYVTVFSLSQTTGVLTPLQTFDMTQADPTSLVVDQSLVYVVNWPVNLQPTGPFIPSNITLLKRDTTTGMLSAGASPVVMQDQEGLQGAALMHFQ